VTHRTVEGVILHYDDDCGLCTHSVRWLARRSRGVEYRKLSTGIGEQESVVLELDDGSELCGAPAVAAVLRRCGRAWQAIGGLMLLPGVAHLAAVLYRLVARNRSRISRALGWGVCEIEPRL
jgi:predicted DCC family thiol-disulfide oxidoreductase YuxK